MWNRNTVRLCCAVALAVTAMLGSAGSAGATTFIVDVSAPPIYAPDSFGHIEALGSATFPDVVLHVGDDLQLTVEFGSPLQVPNFSILASDYELNLPRGAANGSARFDYPYMEFVNVGNGSTSFTIDATASQNFGPPNTTATFDVNSISYSFRGAPEPAVWTIMLLGLGAVGGALRVARRKTAAVLAGQSS